VTQKTCLPCTFSSRKSHLSEHFCHQEEAIEARSAQPVHRRCAPSYVISGERQKIFHPCIFK
jgi:hypothetical protein